MRQPPAPELDASPDAGVSLIRTEIQMGKGRLEAFSDDVLAMIIWFVPDQRIGRVLLI
ncbi:MAG: hypothetical protein ACRESI_00690 [Gammaproteobacteria bacterium]